MRIAKPFVRKKSVFAAANKAILFPNRMFFYQSCSKQIAMFSALVHRSVQQILVTFVFRVVVSHASWKIGQLSFCIFYFCATQPFLLDHQYLIMKAL